ncbi:MAG: Slp family lipoprotein [Deltaproteobacteria bacterium]|nr:Slp family lipoprotein [Deltaproteobacteria bacterium]MBW2012895.1 Slp family lipoprotein [Deltaproteobacteria bacterium]MBW2088323.1 Slp family lipoprotein [Deltaproteobacteria bacterium]MBW2320160.1 Slp family lipoprotein [Deltaproteobacteria bacterium]
MLDARKAAHPCTFFRAFYIVFIFLVQSKQFLDPAIYQKGMLLTLVGILKGSKVLSIGGFDYVYPFQFFFKNSLLCL